jgi:inner membrane protein
MTARTHDLAALSLLGAIVIIEPERTITLSTAVVAILANLIGGITPDIDQPTAPLWHNLPVGKYFGKTFDKLAGGHRFLTHSILGLAIFGLLARLFLDFISPIARSVNLGLVWWAFMIGMFSHLVMDSLTKEGVPWLLPLPYKFGFPPIKDLRIKTGHWAEKLIIFPGLLAIDLILYLENYQKVLDILHKHIV